MSRPIAIVSFQDQHADTWYTVTSGRSLFEAVGDAARFFADSVLKGPKTSIEDLQSDSGHVYFNAAVLRPCNLVEYE